MTYQTPEGRKPLGIPQMVYDYWLCEDIKELEKCLHQINESGWTLISVTEPKLCVFHVFFQRPAYG